MDPDWKTTWGIGFAVRNANGTSAVGHGGGCPGYITAFEMVPSQKIAAVVLTNASDGPAGKIAQNILKLVAPTLKAKNAQESPTVNLEDYVGNYGGSIWGGESAIRV